MHGNGIFQTGNRISIAPHGHEPTCFLQSVPVPCGLSDWLELINNPLWVTFQQLRTPTEVIVPSQSERLLGAWIHQDMKWDEHLQDSEDSLIRSLSKRLGALKLIGRVGNFKTRKLIANGIFLSKLSYLIALWGGCNLYLLKSLQTLQNKAARIVTKQEWSTPSAVLLGQCGWLSVHQLVADR